MNNNNDIKPWYLRLLFSKKLLWVFDVIGNILQILFWILASPFVIFLFLLILLFETLNFISAVFISIFIFIDFLYNPDLIPDRLKDFEDYKPFYSSSSTERNKVYSKVFEYWTIQFLSGNWSNRNHIEWINLRRFLHSLIW